MKTFSVQENFKLSISVNQVQVILSMSELSFQKGNREY